MQVWVKGDSAGEEAGVWEMIGVVSLSLLG